MVQYTYLTKQCWDGIFSSSFCSKWWFLDFFSAHIKMQPLLQLQASEEGSSEESCHIWGGEEHNMTPVHRWAGGNLLFNMESSELKTACRLRSIQTPPPPPPEKGLLESLRQLWCHMLFHFTPHLWHISGPSARCWTIQLFSACTSHDIIIFNM